MPTEHVVQQGETVAKIAAQYGFANWRTVWDDAANGELARLRKNPDVLAPGDVLVVPDKTEGQVECSVGKRTVFRVQSSPLKLRLALRDFDHEPLRNTKCTLSVAGTSFELETDAEGLLEATIPNTAEEAELRFHDPQVPFDLSIPIRIGHLDPIDTLSGQAARLNNLGYHAGSPDDEDRTAFEHAVQEFQVDHDLAVDGVCGPETQSKLEELHGS